MTRAHNRLSIWDDETAIRNAVANSRSIAETLRALGFPKGMGSKPYNMLRKVCAEYEIELHFPKKYESLYKISDDEALVENAPHKLGNIDIKKRALRNGLINVCSICGQKPEWNGKPLTLQLDHINGINNDHRIENLRILCPNCHTQTETFAGRGHRRPMTGRRKTGPRKPTSTVINGAIVRIVSADHA